MKKVTVILVLFIMMAGCKKSDNTNVKSTNNQPVNKTDQAKPVAEHNNFAPQSVDEDLAKSIADFLVLKHLSKDISTMEKSNRKFQFYKIDLNEDGNEEIFVRFFTPYFCGTGGCNFLLLDKHNEIITNFSVTRAPIFVENTKVNGWKILLVKDAGVFKELKFENGSYPSNPSMVEKAPYDAPSGHAEVMFDDHYSKAKTYSF